MPVIPGPPPTFGIPLRKLMRAERVRYYTYAVVLLVIVPAVLIGALFVFLHRNDITDASVCCCCSLAPVLIAAYVVGLSRMGRLDGNMTYLLIDEQLRRYGSTEEMLDRVDAELAELAGAWVSGRRHPDPYNRWPDCWVITDRWLIRVAHQRFLFVPLDDLLWVHKRIAVKGGLLWSDTFTHSLCVLTERGWDQAFPVRGEELLDKLLEELVARRPALLYGFTGNYRDVFRQGKPALRAAVERRRAAWEQASPDDREDWREDTLDDATDCVERVGSG